MAKLLYIESSPRKDRSKSIKVANAFLDEFKSAHPDDQIDTLDLWDVELPVFDGQTINAKYQVLHGLDHDADQAAAWQQVADIADRFKSADKYVISVPMWNFGIPYKLKHYIDVITQPGLTFNYSPETGYTGLVTDRPAAVIYARGGAYSDDGTRGMDFQKPYVELWLGFVGFKDIRPLVIEPTLAAPEDVQATEAAAVQQARSLAASL